MRRREGARMRWTLIRSVSSVGSGDTGLNLSSSGKWCLNGIGNIMEYPSVSAGLYSIISVLSI